MYCAFIDYENVLINLNDSIFGKKLLRENVSSKIVKALQAMYSEVKQCVRYKCET